MENQEMTSIGPNGTEIVGVGQVTIADGQDLPTEGFVRQKQFVGKGKAIPVSHTTWWAGVKSGRYPSPVKLGPRITAWRVSDIRKLIEQIAT